MNIVKFKIESVDSVKHVKVTITPDVCNTIVLKYLHNVDYFMNAIAYTQPDRYSFRCYDVTTHTLLHATPIVLIRQPR